MALAFAEVAFTPDVLAQQERFGSADLYSAALSPDRDGGRVLGPRETSFLQARDGFFQATVSETGWPYVQFRGGTPGFLKVLDPTTIGYADYRGNRQYISAGNLSGNDRIALIAVDYATRKRLKVWGTVRIAEDTETIEALRLSGAPVAERAILIQVAAFDWNCPQHIPIRLTDAERNGEIAALRAQVEDLQKQLADNR